MKLFGRLLAFAILAKIKILSHLLFRHRLTWSPELPKHEFFKNTRMIVFLNHTSLYEPLYSCALPFSFLWRMSAFANVPGADITLDRPIVGFFWKLMLPRIASITRKRDDTWSTYLESIQEEDVIMITPEGRMKRLDGLDKNGKPMTVRGGIADIIERLNGGDMVLALSGGLHHVQAPGELIPRVFKTIKMNIVRLDINEYKAQFTGDPREVKLKIVADLQRRLENDCPKDAD